MPPDTKSKRCAPCDWNWPTSATYDTCPVCLAPTERDRDLKPDEGSFPKAQAWQAWHAYEANRLAEYAITLADLDEDAGPIPLELAVAFADLDDEGKGTS